MIVYLNVIDPEKGQSIMLTAKKDALHRTEGWWITMDGHLSFFMVMEKGLWRIVEGHRITDDLLDAVGLFLHPLALGNLLNYQLRPSYRGI